MWAALLPVATVLLLTRSLNVNSKVLSENDPAQSAGFSAEEQRIVGGEKARPGQFPYVAAFHYNGQFICTCSLISTTTVLIAAHCVVLGGEKQSASRFHVNYGTTKRSSSSRKANIESITVHPDYSETTLDGDIAVMRTTEPMQLDGSIASAICLLKTLPLICKKGTAAGWGLTRPGPPELTPIPPAPEDLYYVPLEISSQKKCEKIYPNTITERHICARSPYSFWLFFPKFKGVCSGDSGGPFFSVETCVQIGVASFVHRAWGCGSPYIAGNSVYTFIPFYADWVNNATNDSEICYA